MSEQSVNSVQPGTKPDKDDEVHILDLLIILGRHKKVVIGLPLITGAMALAASMLMTPIFTSAAAVMPPQQQQSAVAAMLGQLGGLASVAGGIGGIKSPADLYIGLLESRTVADNLISRFKLKERYDKETMEETRKELAKMRAISSGKKDGLITVAASDKDPKVAAAMANAYVEELVKLNQTMALTEASQRRQFFEKQLKETKELLANAEVALRAIQEKTGMILPSAQVEAIITNAAQLKGAIAAKEVELNAMRSFAAGKNPELMRAQEELRGMQAQLAKLEKSQSANEGDFMVPTARIPGVGMQYVRSVRDVKYYETIYELLAKQFELAKIDEARDASSIQVLDPAIPAERKSKPRRALITLTGLVSGALLGIWWAFIAESYGRSRRNPDGDNRWKQLTSAWTRTPRKLRA